MAMPNVRCVQQPFPSKSEPQRDLSAWDIVGAEVDSFPHGLGSSSIPTVKKVVQQGINEGKRQAQRAAQAEIDLLKAQLVAANQKHAAELDELKAKHREDRTERYARGRENGHDEAIRALPRIVEMGSPYGIHVSQVCKLLRDDLRTQRSRG